MALCAVETALRRIPLRGVPDTGGSQWLSTSDPKDLERLRGYWVANGIRPFEVGIDAAKAAVRESWRQQRRGRVPDVAGLARVGHESLSPNSRAGKLLESMLAEGAPPPPSAEVVALLQRYECVLHEEWIEPGAEVVVIGTWNAAAGWIETASTTPAQPGDKWWSGRAGLHSPVSAALIRLPARAATVPLKGGWLLAPTLGLLLAVLVPLAWFIAPLATARPQFPGHLSSVDVALIAVGDLEPLKRKLLEPSDPPAQVAHYRARLAAGEAIPDHWPWRLARVAEFERVPAEVRRRTLVRVLEVLRPDLNRLGGAAISPYYVNRSIGRFPLLDTRGASLDLLLRHGADPNFANWQPYTALLDAASECDVERVQRLLDAGADPNRPRSAVDQSLQWLFAGGDGSLTPFADDCRRATERLVAAGGRGGSSAVLAAVVNRDREELAWLLQTGVDVDGDDPDRGSPLEAAVFAHRAAEEAAERADHEYAIARLRAAGARSWQVDAAGGTAIGSDHPAAQAVLATYAAIQARDEAAILRLYPGHGRWRAGRVAEELEALRLDEPMPPFEVMGFANDRLATLRFRGKRADGSGFDWYAQLVYREAGRGTPAGWTLRRRWGGEPRPF